MQVNHHLLEGRALELPYSEARVKNRSKAGTKPIITQSDPDFFPMKVQA